jgi:uncharacterized membrane protein YiaA
MKQLLFLILIILLITACVPGDGKHTAKRPAGFFWGIWHGWIATVSLIWGLFNHTIHIYEKNNVGWFYDLGFYLAIIGGFGTLSLSRNSRK